MNDVPDRHHPTFSEDASHLSTIALSALTALVVTGGLLGAAFRSDSSVMLEPSVMTIEVVPEILEPVDALAGADRLFAVVTTTDGDLSSGYIRWPEGPVSTVDVLPARAPGSTALAGIRLGHVDRISPRLDGGLSLLLKSGEKVERTWLGSGPPQSLEIESTAGTRTVLPWADLESIDFREEPIEHAPTQERVWGTVSVGGGLDFSGFLQVGDASVFGDDVPAGLTVALADLASIGRETNGRLTAIDLEGGVHHGDAPQGGRVVVSDPSMGSVEVPWDRVRGIRFHAPDPMTAYPDFDGGRPLSGSVTTTDGESLKGTLRWDLQEDSDWEMLDGQYEGLHFHIEFSQISWIRKTWMGSTVELWDGRSFYLIASNDVNAYNAGIEVHVEGGNRLLDWNDFEEVRFVARR